MTNYLVSLHRLLDTSHLIAPLVARMVSASHTQKILDLCSGSGGPMVATAEVLRTDFGFADLQLTLSDYFPNTEALVNISSQNRSWIRYESSSVNASDVRIPHDGVRTMICSLHHMRPEKAKEILQHAAEKRRPFFAFEISDNSLPALMWWLPFPMTIVMTLLLTPWVRPLTFQQIFFTYVIPILPVLIAWDGMVSNARTYTESDLKFLTQSMSLEGYRFEIGTLRKPGLPLGMTYILGSSDGNSRIS